MIFYLSIGQIQQEFSCYYQPNHACSDFRAALTTLPAPFGSTMGFHH